MIPIFSGYGHTKKVYTYNYITSGNRLPKKNRSRHDQSSRSRHASSKAKGEKEKEDKISKDAQSPSDAAKQQIEEYVEMTSGDEERTQTPQDYEVPALAYL